MVKQQASNLRSRVRFSHHAPDPVSSVVEQRPYKAKVSGSTPLLGTIESPCIKLCKLDANTQRCTGCKRTILEIQQWAYLTDLERTAIIEELSQRPA